MELKTISETEGYLAFKEELNEGLSRKPKSISSKFFYDAIGDNLFQQIMQLDEYYLTRSEFSIFNQQSQQILEHISPSSKEFNLIELGAGDGSKTKILLNHFIDQGVDLSYYPVDISKHILNELESDLSKEIPDLDCRTINEEYFSALNTIKEINNKPNVVFFLGSNIGNFSPEAVHTFFSSLRASLRPGDMFFIGVDLKKDPELILKAYSDSKGVTAKFNLNLLTRANKELDANFDLDAFKHYASYNPENGEARSYLISLKEQSVHIGALNKDVLFLKSEYIHTEISKKYNLSELQVLAEDHGFEVKKHFIDKKEYFVNSLWTLK